MYRHLFEELLQLLPKRLRSRAVIAGGFAASPLKAKDIDIWVLTNPLSMEQNEIFIRQHLAGNTAVLLDDGAADYAGSESLLVATVSGFRLPVQLLVTTAKTPLELVNGFDISTHAIAWVIGPMGTRVVYGDNWTSIWEAPRVLRQHPQTEFRLEKICDRYGLKPAEDYASYLTSTSFA